MRHLVAALIVAILVLALWWQLARVDTVEFERLIPADILAVLVINRFPNSLDFVEQTRLRDWIEIDLNDRPEIRELYDSDLFETMRRDVENMWLCLHGISLSEGGAYRIDFTAYVMPKKGLGQHLVQVIETAVVARFGSDGTSLLEEDEVRSFRGEQKGHIFYLKQTEGFLAMSNTEAGWLQCSLAQGKQIPSLSESPSYRRIVENLDLDSDLFLYFRGSRALISLPGFGYTVDIEENSVRDAYYEIAE